MRKYMVVIVLLLAVAYCRGTTNEANVVALVSLAISPGAERTDERVRAMNDLVRWRSSTIVLLITEVEKEPTKGEAWWLEGTARNVAMQILGKFRAKEAIPALIKWLRPREHQNMVVDHPLRYSPAAKALVEIGYDAVGPVMEFIATEGDELPASRASKIIVAIIGTDGARRELEKQVATEKDGMRRDRLKEALEALTESAQ